jgi:HB1, ASXL, restriction endonuclease HTH domain
VSHGVTPANNGLKNRENIMASKKNKRATSNTTNLTALRIGTRIRCTEDGVEGRIVWANAVAVKIKWDDGEQVTWKRDALATRPLEILDVADEGDQTPAPAATDSAEGSTASTVAEQPVAPANEPTATTEQAQAEPETTAATTEQPLAEEELTPATADPTATETATTATEPTATERAAVPEATLEPATASADAAAAPTATKPQRQRQAPATRKEKKISALDAAAKVLAEEGRSMTCQELIAAMAAKGYWTSPGGQTPDATLYSAILREVSTKGTNSRFQKTERGKFARTPAA